MRARTAWIAFLLFAAPAAAIAQENVQPRFAWQEPDRVSVDATGEVTYQLINNPANFTVREFMFGVWRTSWYRPGTDLVVRYDEGDSTVEWIYDKSGTLNEDRTYVDGLTFIIGTPNNFDFSMSGLGVLHRETRSDGRMSAIRDEQGNVLAAFSYDDDGVFQRLTFADSSSFTVSRAGEHMLRTTIETGGRILDARTVRQREMVTGTPSSCLDVVAKLFSSEEWQTRTIPVARTAWIDVVRDRNGEILLYVVRHSNDKFGFDRSGKVVYAELITWVSSPHDDEAARRGNDGNYELGDGVLPSRIVITADGRVGACIGDYDFAGQIQSIWLERTESTPTIAYR